MNPSNVCAMTRHDIQRQHFKNSAYLSVGIALPIKLDG